MACVPRSNTLVSAVVPPEGRLRWQLNPGSMSEDGSRGEQAQVDNADISQEDAEQLATQQGHGEEADYGELELALTQPVREGAALPGPSHGLAYLATSKIYTTLLSEQQVHQQLSDQAGSLQKTCQLCVMLRC